MEIGEIVDIVLTAPDNEEYHIIGLVKGFDDQNVRVENLIGDGEIREFPKNWVSIASGRRRDLAVQVKTFRELFEEKHEELCEILNNFQISKSSRTKKDDDRFLRLENYINKDGVPKKINASLVVFTVRRMMNPPTFEKLGEEIEVAGQTLRKWERLESFPRIWPRKLADLAIEYSEALVIPPDISIQQELTEIDLPPKEIVARLGISSKTVRNWEKGVCDPNSTSKAKLVSLLEKMEK